jgi:hypothetical protein
LSAGNAAVVVSAVPSGHSVATSKKVSAANRSHKQPVLSKRAIVAKHGFHAATKLR